MGVPTAIRERFRVLGVSNQFSEPVRGNSLGQFTQQVLDKFTVFWLPFKSTLSRKIFNKFNSLQI